MTILRSCLTALALCLAALATAACGGPSRAAVSPSDPAAAGAAVVVQGIAYQPGSLSIAVGTQVTWTNADAGVAHTVTSGTPGEDAVPGVSPAQPSSPDGRFSGQLDADGAVYRYRFTEPGSYAYFCEIHPSMTGDVVVR